jgi:hypothetical protein
MYWPLNSNRMSAAWRRDFETWAFMLRKSVLRSRVMLSLATAMVSGLALGPYSGKGTGETALFRQLLDRLSTGDVVLADRYFCSYFMIHLLRQRGVDLVSHLHQKRTADFRRGQRLGPGDHIVEWLRPERPDWMDEATYEQMPASIQIREVEVAVPAVPQPGLRPRAFVVATTLRASQCRRAPPATPSRPPRIATAAAVSPMLSRGNAIRPEP